MAVEGGLGLGQPLLQQAAGQAGEAFQVVPAAVQAVAEPLQQLATAPGQAAMEGLVEVVAGSWRVPDAPLPSNLLPVPVETVLQAATEAAQAAQAAAQAGQAAAETVTWHAAQAGQAAQPVFLVDNPSATNFVFGDVGPETGTVAPQS